MIRYFERDMNLQEKILTWEQLDLIENNLISPSHKRFFAIARYTGQHPSTVLKLKVSDVYNELAAPYPEIRFIHAKGKIHYAIACSRLRQLLISYVPNPFYFHKWLFPSSFINGSSISFSSIDKCLRSSIKRSGMEVYNVSTNSIRKSFIQHLFKNGMHEEDIKKILGLSKRSILVREKPKRSINLRVEVEKIFASSLADR